MNDDTKQNLEEALRVITSMIHRSQKAQEKFSQATPQYTLQKNRIRALDTASALIKKELSENDITEYTKEDLEAAVKPIASLIDKSEKARNKLKQGTWQHTMLGNHLKALYIVSPLLTKVLHEMTRES